LDDLARGNDVVNLQQHLVENGHVNNNDNDSKSTALHTAATKGYTEVVVALINAGGDIRLKNWRGWTPAHLAAHYGRLEVLKLLLSLDEELLHMTDSAGNSLLNLAANKGNEEIVEYLLRETDADFNIKNKHGYTAFHSAAQANRLKVIKILCKYCPECIDEQNKMGNTPLHLASERGYTGIIQLLLSKEAQCEMRNKRNRLPYQVATKDGKKVFRKFEQYKEILAM